ncbi:uncharacterized protein CEXT_328831 [Caerostris extrusa]|uniref:Apextrin C-terminal domain-containing protein n=1 Tax=Caerostris extrusa TaxID=172846 RepID=A0AAV4PZE9_CAEEX|nr:uncharacterized protein CEXT_328831 [Caerostris extrusa]
MSHKYFDFLCNRGKQQKTKIGSNEQKSGVAQHFCMKTTTWASQSKPQKWPKGEYCILQYGNRCPDDFQSGYITWRDTNNTSSSQSHTDGYTPAGNYTVGTTRIFYCCRNDGSSKNKIQLPNDAPFYLLKAGKYCQKVEGDVRVRTVLPLQ